MFEMAFCGELEKVATTPLQDVLAGMEPSLTKAHEVGLYSTRDHKRHLRNVAAGGALSGALVNLVTGAAGAGGLMAWSHAKGQPLRRRLAVAIAGGAQNVGRKVRALAKPWKYKADAGVAVGLLGAGGAFQAAQVANQYRLGQRARRHTEKELARRDRERWWSQYRPSHLRLPGMKQASLVSEISRTLDDALRSSRKYLIGATLAGMASGGGAAWTIPEAELGQEMPEMPYAPLWIPNDAFKVYRRYHPAGTTAMGTLMGLGLGLYAGKGLRNRAFRRKVLQRWGPGVGSRILKKLPKDLGYGIKPLNRR